MQQNSSSKTQIIVVSILLGLGVLVLVALLAFAFRGNIMQLAAVPATQTQAVPTPPCIEPTLTLGMTTFHVKTIPNNPNAFPALPQDAPDTAYWVEGTMVNYVFGLSSVGNNLALNTSLKAGDPMVINWGDCSKDEYIVSAMDMLQPADLSIFDQSTGGITVYVQSGAANIVVRGQRPVVRPGETALPEPTSEFQIDVAFSEQPAADDQTVRIGLTITNRGNQAITLNNNDISLTVENNPEVFPSAVEPALPQEITPGNSVQIIVTFPKPAANIAVLRIFDTTLDYYF
jgi:hypothetical protein